MAVRHYTVTLTATATPLLTLISASFAVGGPRDEAFRFLSVQAGKANTNDAFLGGSTLTTSDYGVRVDAGDTAPPIDIIGHYDSGPVKLSEIYAVGTAGEKLHVFGIPF